ncbi:NADPH-dependent FMN reductase [Aeromicrobium sp. CTD01-1L150]|uniref:NADPH-dependent FMN reductase n=1 Tax=Aeromicrobium sp. CTD01-1L150 TaxID=3341830 RepID=UPI0035C0AFD2
MPRLAVIIASSRPGRLAGPVAEWFVSLARQRDDFEIDVVDLAEVGLPFLDEPNHPRLRNYVHDHTKAWSSRVEAADAFVIVTPEYNFGMPAILKNALDFLHQEWAHKPVAFVSYGGISAGTRSVQMTKQVVTTLRMIPVTTAVSIPFVHQSLDDSGRLVANEVMTDTATAVLDELAALEQALRPLRAAA